MSDFISKANAETMINEYINSPEFHCIEHPMELDGTLEFTAPKEVIRSFMADAQHIRTLIDQPGATKIVVYPAVKMASNNPSYKHLTLVLAAVDANNEVIGMRPGDVDNGSSFLDYVYNCPKTCN